MAKIKRIVKDVQADQAAGLVRDGKAMGRPGKRPKPKCAGCERTFHRFDPARYTVQDELNPQKGGQFHGLQCVALWAVRHQGEICRAEGETFGYAHALHNQKKPKG